MATYANLVKMVRPRDPTLRVFTVLCCQRQRTPNLLHKDI